MQTWQEYLVRSKVAGTSFGSFTTAKTVINTSDLRTLPADFFEIGRCLDLKICGGIGNLVTTPGTIVFQVMLGSIIVFTTGVIQLNATAHTNLPFWLDIALTCRAVGSGTSANLMGQGKISGVMFTSTAAQVDGVNTMTTLLVPATAPAVGTGFNSTIANQLDLFVGFSISDAANTVKIETYDVKFAG
jgi:hypothetical protein